MNVICAQLVGFFALLLLVLSFTKNNKKELLFYQTISNFLCAFQYVLLGAFSGFFMFLVAGFRNILFSKTDKPSFFSLVLIILMITFFSMFSYKSNLSLLPVLGILNYSYAVWTGNLKLIRIIDICACILFIIYDLCVMGYVAFIIHLIEMISALIALYRFDIRGNKKW